MKSHRCWDDVLFARFSSCFGDAVRGNVSDPSLRRQLFAPSSALLETKKEVIEVRETRASENL